MSTAFDAWFSLRGKTAIVTGASRGLGKEIAETLAQAGADLVIHARHRDSLEEVAASIRSRFGVKVHVHAGDIGVAGAAESLVEAACKHGGRVDIIVNNAGINVRGAIDDVTPEDFDSVFSVNVKGPWLLCRAASGILRSQRSGRVVNIASTLGLVARSDRTLYCSSKGAVVQLTRSLAVEWATFGVTVNAICPGPFKTEMNRVLVEDPVAHDVFANYTAMKRWGEPGELGPAVLFLASPAASYITGACLTVDGGWTVKS